MCGLLFEYDVRLSVKLYFAKSYMNIRTKRQVFLPVFFFCLNQADFARNNVKSTYLAFHRKPT